jgi:PAP2 superfamily protein
MSLSTRSARPHSHPVCVHTPSLSTWRTSLQLAFVLAIPILSACADRVTDPTSSPSLSSSASSTRSFPTTLASVGWQEQGRLLVASHPATMSPLNSTRAYGLLGVAQYGAVVAADKQVEADGMLPADGFADGGRSRFEAERGAIAGASTQILSFLFADAATALEQRLTDEGKTGPGGVHPYFTRGVAIGRAWGDVMVAWAYADGFSNTACTPPVTSTCWFGDYPAAGSGHWTRNPAPIGGTLPPIAGPQFGAMKPYFLTSPAQFHPVAPPALNSQAYADALAEVVTISNARTPDQLADARAWNLPPGTISALGYWDRLAAQYIGEHNFDERAAAHVFALTNAAAMDAVIGCWESKFTYFLIRPSRASSAVALDLAAGGIGLPNHPSYTSGHSCVSAAAGAVIEAFFPEHTTTVDGLVAAAGESRIRAGIHYRFDVVKGQALGRSVAGWAIAYDRDRGLLAAVR